MWDRLRILETIPEHEDVPMAAVLAPLYEDDHGHVRIILTKRPDTMPTHAGHIAFPGGRAHPEDDGPVDTALREAHEEVGIDREQVTILGFLPAIHTVEFKPWVIPVVGRIGTPLGLIPSEREVEKVYTPLVSELADESRWWSVPWNGHQVWYYELEGDLLWGATARMVRSLLDLP